MKLIHRALVAALAFIGAVPSESSAQIFLASKAHPDFAVGPLFLIANVRPDLSVTVNLPFSLTLRKGAARAAMEQDLFLLWPAEVAEPGPADPALAIYFDHRDRVARLAREFSQVIASFSDSDHLLIDGIEPATATRRPSRIRAGSEVVALVLTPMDGIAPQNLQVQFSYFSGRIAWRPIVVSLALLLLTNVAGTVMFGREMFGVIRARRRARAAAAGRLRAEWLTGDAQAGGLSAPRLTTTSSRAGVRPTRTVNACRPRAGAPWSTGRGATARRTRWKSRLRTDASRRSSAACTGSRPDPGVAEPGPGLAIRH